MGDSTLVQIPFAGSLDQSVSDEYLDPNQSAVSVTNATYQKNGKISKRIGVAYLTNTAVAASSLPTPTTGVNAVSWSRSALTVMSQGGLYTYDNQNNGTVGVSKLPTVGVLRRAIPNKPTAQTPSPGIVDFPYGSGTRRMTLTQTQAGTYASVSDADTGDVYLEPTLLSTATTITAAFYQAGAAAGAQVLIFISNLSTTTLFGYTFNPATNAFSAPVTLTTALNIAIAPCVVPFENDPNGGFVLLDCTTAGTLNIKYYTNLATNTVSKTFTYSGTLQFPAYVSAIYGVGAYIAFATQVSTTITFFAQGYTGDGLFNQSGVTVTVAALPSTPYPFLTGLCVTGSITAYVSIAVPTSTAIPSSTGISSVQQTWYTVTAASNVVQNTGLFPFCYYPAARPFVAPTGGGVIFQPCYFLTYLQASPTTQNPFSQQQTLYLMRVESATNGYQAKPYATVAPRQVDTANTLLAFLFSALGILPATSVSNSGLRHSMTIQTATSDFSASRGAIDTAWAVDFFFDQAHLQTLFQAHELGSELHISGPVPFRTDAVQAFEHSFFYYPERSYLTISGGTSSGKKGYAVIYAHVDSAGNIDRSAPYFVTQDLSLGVSAVLNILAYQGTWRDSANPGTVFAEVYRTILNGSTYYYLDSIQVSNVTGPYVAWPASGTDGVSDAAAQLATTLYTTGGVLDNVNPPSFAMQVSHQNRIAGVDETLRNVWFSQKYVGGSSPGFNEGLIVPFPEGGDITALASMDDKFVLFKSGTIYVQTGDGPAQTGTNSDWIVQRVASDVGAVNNYGVLLTPQGLFFMSSQGLLLLDRSLQVQNLGQAVQDITTAFPIPVASTLVPRENEARFVLQNSAGTLSTVLVYNYFFQKWSQVTYAQLSAPVVGATLSLQTQQFSFITTDGQIWRERLSTDANAYLDQDTGGALHYVPRTFTTGWFKIGGVMGYQRARRILAYGSQATACGLTVSVAVNYDPTIVQNWTYEELPSGIPTNVQMHVAARYTKQESIQITLTDDPYNGILGSDSGQGFDFTALGIELQPIGTYFRKVSNQAKA